MSRKVDNPRIILLDCPLEYKKGESQTSVEMTAETDFTRPPPVHPSLSQCIPASLSPLQPFTVHPSLSHLSQSTPASPSPPKSSLHPSLTTHYFPQIGDEYFTFITKCQDPKVERNLQDALGVAWNLALEPRLVPGGSAVGMAVSNFLQQKAKGVSGVRQWPYSALAQALELLSVPSTATQHQRAMST
ncbi:T-complex protein 1 subunit gamma-like [Scylla paramamosain]|uniref:T-complex protein 1 subunit gamma-like n=1 Tax=Scylla paramamosain TaxID=85552 RepID=UPI003083CF56